MKNLKDRIASVIEKVKKDGTYIDKETGRKCVKAASKIKYFTEEFVGEIGIVTNIDTHEDFYIATAKINTPEGTLATGHAKVFRNKPKSFELAETFAISRALRFFSVMDDNITSKEELDEVGVQLEKEGSSAEVIDLPNKRQALVESTSVEYIVDKIKSVKHLSELHFLKNVKFAEEFNDALQNHPSTYKKLMNAYDVQRGKLKQITAGAIKNG